ncbi:CxxxxCH/CxxCH domain c-type cytochrome [Pelotalea chapellei]|uniref:CxxxxCH/CxxCH domain-containing protein n=1 Tax=Pelotalea chapellei TaxID=44671 RepID=A0ABS5UA14_9BACT|nr:CxxxxCH/CxxCH domain-containing protein [Pelotalea chapellei]MBT1072495.1 CxxxxCH/CxxCH domain-containing protein [Pelotalea chapellei]
MVGKIRTGQGNIFICMLLALMALSLLDATAQAGTITSCSGCHGMPPVDATYRNISTGGIVGNHLKHLASPADPAGCTKCHNNSGYLSSHRDGVIQLASNVNLSPAPGGGQYKVAGNAVTFRNQTSIPILGTCANVNCHFEAATPQWGSAAFNSPADCNKCHGVPPSGGAAGAAGSHAKHELYYSGVSNCQKCHSNNTTFQHATSAGKRNLNISFAAAPNNGEGAYSGALNDYLPSQNPTGTAGFGTCTATYCHSPGDKASAFNPPVVVPTWGTPLPANCTGCHKADAASGNIIASGSHTRHVTGFYSFKCSRCHAATVNGSMAITDSASHVNGKVNIKFNSLTTAVNGIYATQATPFAKDPGTAKGQCNNVYCHSNGQNDGGIGITYKTPTWGGANSRCGTCHDVNATHNFSGSEIGTGSHTKHLAMSAYSGPAQCITCHDVGRDVAPTEAFSSGCTNTCHNAYSKHVDGKIDIVFPAKFGATAQYNGSAIPGTGYNSCSNVSCHYNTTTPTWGTGTPINCVGCHSLAILMASGAHAKHISNTVIPTMYNYTANRSTAGEYNFGCSNCHPLTVASHMNGTVNVTLNKDEPGKGTLRSKNNATTAGINTVNSGITGISKTNIVCSASYCHSNGNTANLIYATTPNWYGTGFPAGSDRCANCHGNAPNSTIAGSKAHYNNRFLGFTSTPGGHQIGIHAMNIYSSPSGLAKAGTSGRSSHGNAANATTISCNTCHFATITTGRNDDNAVCKVCHFAGNTVGALAGNSAVIADKSKHVNGLVNVAFNPVAIKSKAQMRQATFATAPYSSVWKRNVGYKVSGSYDSAKTTLNTATMWDGTDNVKTCSNVACHNGQTVKWSDNNGVTTCVSCHTSL